MIESRAYHGLKFTIARSEGNKVCYILLPEGLHKDGMQLIETLSEKFLCNIVLVTEMDWNGNLTPWAAPGVFKKEKPFGGHSGDFLKGLLGEYFPSIEGALGLHKPDRFLVGVSLSGLFAIWTLFQTDSFKAVASISGSLWYDRFVDWSLKQTLVNSTARIYLSLGDKEKNSKNARIAEVENATGQIVKQLAACGCEVDYQIIEGTHFSPIVPRLEQALNIILAKS